jgi:UDP-N-acetylglucosamine/UDP-N-acetylgalactosamine diphosphorylase
MGSAFRFEGILEGSFMSAVPESIRTQLEQHGQEHVLAWWDHLTDPERKELAAQIQGLDLDQLKQLYAERDQAHEPPSADRIGPVEVLSPGGADDARARQIGEEALRQGQVAMLVVAGGQGTRLGFDRPKGIYPVGPVSGKSLFQIHAEKVLARGRRHGKVPPFLVMTSPATHAETIAYLESWDYFGLPANRVYCFCQGTMPALDLASGKLLLETRSRLFLGPDGHGGTLTALASSGLLDQLAGQGIRHIFYFQVDNPLVHVADPVYLGYHIDRRAEISCKVVAKSHPTEKMGNFALVDGRCQMIEYSDLPESLAVETDAQGKLKLWAGNPAIHLFEVNFLRRLTSGGSRACALPFHVARKKVPYLDANGVDTLRPEDPNALKFERFIFDVLPLAERWLLLETKREEEFSPLKSAEGADTPQDVRRGMTELATNWLQQAGVAIPRTPGNTLEFDVEISPLFALDAAELHNRIDPRLVIDRPMYFR